MGRKAVVAQQGLAQVPDPHQGGVLDPVPLQVVLDPLHQGVHREAGPGLAGDAQKAEVLAHLRLVKPEQFAEPMAGDDLPACPAQRPGKPDVAG